MKDTDDKREKHSGEVISEPGRRIAPPSRSARRVARRASKKTAAPIEGKEEVSNGPRTEREADITVMEYESSRFAARTYQDMDPDLDPYMENFEPVAHSAELPVAYLIPQQSDSWRHLAPSTRSDSFETLPEYFAEEEAEAAMLEADLAMSADECASTCDEGLDPAELLQEEI